MLRGDYKRAREKLAAADRKDPGNKYVANNMHLLEESYRQGKQWSRPRHCRAGNAAGAAGLSPDARIARV